MNRKPTVICITPVKNEAWILDRFLKCASLWADHIIIADQRSDDGSRAIAQRYPKVTLIDNPSTRWDENERVSLMLKEARKIPGQRLLLALDADEMLTANFADTPEWQNVLRAAPGTVIKIPRANLLPDVRSFWRENPFPRGFMDDGTEYAGTDIHGPIMVCPSNTPTITLQHIQLLHYQYTDWARMESKHRWYQCWERLHHPTRSAIKVYRQYHHMHAVAPTQIHPVPPEWLRGYEQHGIDMTTIQREATYWWDREVITMFQQHGVQTFRKQAIWDMDWQRNVEKLKLPLTVSDPRSVVGKFFHFWLRKTQPGYKKLWVKGTDKFLTLLG